LPIQAAARFPGGVAGGDAGGEPVPAFLADVFGADEEQASDLEQRIVAAAPMAEGVVGDPSADGVDGPVGEGDRVEVVRHQRRCRQARGEGVGVAPERVDCGDGDLRPPLGAAGLEPVDHDATVSAVSYVTSNTNCVKPEIFAWKATAAQGGTGVPSWWAGRWEAVTMSVAARRRCELRRMGGSSVRLRAVDGVDGGATPS
jgi:hypothetical protein